MRIPRRCSRPGCKMPAVATLTYVYAESTAVVGPLATNAEPHAWDLCEIHAQRITAPKGWAMMRCEGSFTPVHAEDDDLTALAEAVREAGRGERKSRPAPPAASSTGRRGHLRVVPDPVDAE
ncbi:DUF3499 domain-containing protein [Segniliparus rugosus]|nr:DUF3499 domain-containing protein [Segniliparus rugosus]